MKHTCFLRTVYVAPFIYFLIFYVLQKSSLPDKGWIVLSKKQYGNRFILTV